jgi:hypothetical protein
LFKESATAYYLKKDYKLTDSIIVAQKGVITYKDSLILSHKELIRISQNENEVCNMQLKNEINTNKTLTKKVGLFKFTTITGAITTIVVWVRQKFSL